MKLPQKRTKQARKRATAFARAKWKLQNPGALKGIADLVGVRFAYVSDIFTGKAPGESGQGALIRAELVRLGAPGFQVEGKESDGSHQAN
jgi:hypothetical protein